MTIYSIPFRSVENHLYEVLILDKSGEVIDLVSHDIVRLTPSDRPFTLDWDATEDPFLPRRRCTGNISFLTEDPYILKSIHPFTYTDYPVVVSREGRPFFYGFLAPDAFDAPFDSRYHEVTLNVADILTAWDAIDIHNYDSEGVVRVSLQELIATAIEDTMTLFAQYPNQTVPMDIFLPDTIKDLFTKYVSTEWLKEYQTGDGGMPNDAQRKSIGQVMDDILLSIGCQMVQEGKQIMVLAYPFTDSLTTIDGQQTITTDNFSPDYRGTQHTASIFPGAKRLEINARFDYEKPQIIIPEYTFERENEEMFCYALAQQHKENGLPAEGTKPYTRTYMYRKAYLTRYDALPEEMYCYYWHSIDSYTEGEFTTSVTKKASFDDFSLPYANPMFVTLDVSAGNPIDTNDVKDDYYTPPADGTIDRYAGAFLCHMEETYPDYPDRNIRLTGLLVENSTHNLTVCSVYSHRKYYFEPGSYIRFSFDATNFKLGEQDLDIFPYFVRNHIYKYGSKAAFQFRMKIGNYYVDAWEAVSTVGNTFYCTRQQNGNFIYNKTDDELKAMNFSGNGYYIHVPNGGYQDIKIDILTNSDDFNDVKYFFLTGIRIDYMGIPNQFEGTNEDEYTRKTILNARFSDTVSLEPAISSENANRLTHFDNALTDTSGSPVRYFNKKDENGKMNKTSLIEHLEDCYRRFYEKARYKLSLQTTIPFNRLFRAYLSNNLSNRFMLIAKSDDYRQEQSTITLLDTTTKQLTMNNEQ